MDDLDLLIQDIDRSTQPKLPITVTDMSEALRRLVEDMRRKPGSIEHFLTTPYCHHTHAVYS
jgi:hypothetical protein